MSLSIIAQSALARKSARDAQAPPTPSPQTKPKGTSACRGRILAAKAMSELPDDGRIIMNCSRCGRRLLAICVAVCPLAHRGLEIHW